MKMTKNDLIKISVDKELNVSIGVDGNPAEILAALGAVMQDILNGISAETGVDTKLIAQNYAQNAKKIITKNATDNIPEVNDMANKLLTLIDEILDSLEEE